MERGLRLRPAEWPENEDGMSALEQIDLADWIAKVQADPTAGYEMFLYDEMPYAKNPPAAWLQDVRAAIRDEDTVWEPEIRFACTQFLVKNGPDSSEKIDAVRRLLRASLNGMTILLALDLWASLKQAKGQKAEAAIQSLRQVLQSRAGELSRWSRFWLWFDSRWHEVMRNGN